MNVSNIDKGFVEIIDFLNTHGYKPVFSCDGTAENHEEETDGDAYVTLLESEKVYNLIAVLLQTSIFDIDVSNSSYIKPYEVYGNVISGNRYSAYFYNLNGSKTKIFEYLIKNTDSGEIIALHQYLDIIKRAANVVRDEEGCINVLSTTISFNRKILGQSGEGIMVDIHLKEDAEVNVDLKSISEELLHMFKEDGMDMEYYSELNTQIDLDVENGIFSWYNQVLRIHFKNEDFDRVIETIDYIKTMQNNYYYFEEDNSEEA